MNLGFIKQYQGLPRRIYVLFFARMIAAMGAFVYPFLTLFLSSKMGYGELRISQYLLLLSVIYFPASLIGGKCGDIFSRKTVYVVAMSLGELCFIAAGFFVEQSFVVYLIMGGFFFLNVGSPVIAAMMMDCTTDQNRQVSFSLIYLGFNMGYAIGPLVAGFLFESYLPWIFWGNGLLGLVAIILILVKIDDSDSKIGAMAEENNPAELRTEQLEQTAQCEQQGQLEQTAQREQADETDQSGKPPQKKNLFRLLAADKILLIVALFAAVYAFAYSQFAYILPLDMGDVFGIGPASKYYGAMSSFNGIFVFIFTPLLVYIFKKRTPIFNMGIAGALYAIGFGGYAFTHNIVLMYVLVVIWTAGEVMASTNTGVFIANHAPEDYRARYQSIYEIIQGTGRATGPLLMGYFLLNHTISQGWQLVGILCFTVSILFHLLHRSGKK